MNQSYRAKAPLSLLSMNTYSSQQRFLSHAECSLQNQQILESAIADPWARIPVFFRHSFEKYQYQQQKHFLFQLNLLAQIVFLAYFFADFFILSDIGLLSGMVRTLLVVLVLPCCYFMFKQVKQIFLLELLLPVSTTLAVLVWVGLLGYSNSPMIHLYIYSAVLFVIMMNVGVQYSFRTAIYGSVFISTLFFAAAIHLLALEQAMVFMLVYLPILTFSLYISWTQTLNARKHFLRTLMNDWHFHSLQNLAHTDELTQLNNRRQFVHIANSKLGEWSRYEANCVLMFDVDHFKKINDRFGHDIGDEVLQAIANIARQEMRRKDVLARFGGEEFIALLTETTMSEALMISERLLQKIANHPVRLADGTLIHFTISIGMTILRPEQTDIQQLIKEADVALYEAKARGRNCIVQYETDIATQPFAVKKIDPLNFSNRLDEALTIKKKA